MNAASCGSAAAIALVAVSGSDIAEACPNPSSRGSSGGGDPVEAAAEIGHEELTGGVLAERGDREAGVQEQGLGRGRGRVRRDHPDLAAAVVAEDVAADERRDGGASVHVAAGHRAATTTVVVLEQRP